jgi:outer membrane protein assembly factor BamB
MKRFSWSWSLVAVATMVSWPAMAWADQPQPSSPPSAPTANKLTPLEELVASQPPDKSHRKKPARKPPLAMPTPAQIGMPPVGMGLNNGRNEPVRFASKEGIRGWSIAIPGNQPVATPAVVDGKVFIGGGFVSHDFGALDAKNGQPLWYYRANDNGPTAPVVSSNYLSFNTESCDVEVLTTNGQSLWKRRIGDPLTSTPALGNGRLITSFPAANGAHFVAAYDLRNGRPLWQTRVSNEIIVTPVIDDSGVFFATVDGALYCLSPKNGTLLWAERGVHATSTPTIWNDKCWFSRRQEIISAGSRGPMVRQTEQVAFRGLGRNSEVRGLTATTRLADYLDSRKRFVPNSPMGPMAPLSEPSESSVIRRTAPGGFSPEAEIRQAAYETELAEAPQSNSTVVPRQRNAGVLTAQTNLGASGTPDVWLYQGSRPLFYKDRLYAAMGDSLACLDVKSEKVLWKKDFRPGQCDTSPFVESQNQKTLLLAPAVTQPALVNDKVFIGTSYGEVICLSAATGEFLWKATLNDAVVTQPVVARGRVYVVTKSGRLFGLTSDDRDDHGWLMWGANAAHTGSIDEDEASERLQHTGRSSKTRHVAKHAE